MDVAVRSTLEVGLLAEDKVEQLVVEFVVEIDKDWAGVSGGEVEGRRMLTTSLHSGTPIRAGLDVISRVIYNGVGQVGSALD